MVGETALLTETVTIDQTVPEAQTIVIDKSQVEQKDIQFLPSWKHVRQEKSNYPDYRHRLFMKTRVHRLHIARWVPHSLKDLILNIQLP